MEKLSLSIIITVKNEAENLDAMLKELKKINYLEIILLLSNSNNKTQKIADQCGAQVLRFGSKVMMHKMRAVAVKRAKGKVLLFLDANCVINTVELLPLIEYVRNKIGDIALSTFAKSPKPGWINFESIGFMLNIVANRRDLGCGSIYIVPFVISREALLLIGQDSLAVPPLAIFNALKKDLKVKAFQVSSRGNSRLNIIARKRKPIMEECLQSLPFWLKAYGRRSGYTNLGRRFDLLNTQKSQEVFHPGVTAVIAASNEEGTIGAVITNAFNAGVSQVVVVENGSTDKTEVRAREAGAKVVSFPHRIGHDVGRAIGVLNYPSAYYLFLDGDMIIPSHELTPFITAVTKDGVDLALNNLSVMLKANQSWDEVTWSKYFLNCALNRQDLDVNSLTAVPHAISNSAIEIIGPENLAIPTVAMVKAKLAGLNIKAVKEVDVISRNRVRDELHHSDKGNLTEQLIVGDMCQGLYELALHKYGRIE